MMKLDDRKRGGRGLIEEEEEEEEEEESKRISCSTALSLFLHKSAD